MHVRLERSDGMIESIYKDISESSSEAVADGIVANLSRALIVGPVEWVQLTYRELRLAPDGETIALLTAHGTWRLVTTSVSRVVAQHTGAIERDHPFSDVVVY